MDDLVARVLAAIEEPEKNRWRVHDQECDFGSHTTDLTDLAVPSAVCDCPEPENIARRCAADRRIVDMYVTELRVEQEDNPHRIGAARMWGGGKLSGARIALVLVADGYGLVKADDVFSQMAYAEGYGLKEVQ
jgi:hypothetical protein